MLNSSWAEIPKLACKQQLRKVDLRQRAPLLESIGKGQIGKNSALLYVSAFGISSASADQFYNLLRGGERPEIRLHLA